MEDSPSAPSVNASNVQKPGNVSANTPEMKKTVSASPLLMLIIGIVIGLCLSYFINVVKTVIPFYTYEHALTSTEQIASPSGSPVASSQPSITPAICNQDAKQCGDGSYVGRTGPKCLFSVCPDDPSNQKKLTLGIYLSAMDTKGNPIAGEPKANMFITLPDEGVAVEDNVGTDIVKINDTLYIVESDSKTEGLCVSEENSFGCTYNDEVLPHIGTFRIWKDKYGVFALNPQSISINSYYLDKVIITKQGKNKIFSANEVKLWKDILKTVGTEEPPKF